MKKGLLSLILLFSTTALIACGNNSDELNKLKEENQSLKQQLENLDSTSTSEKNDDGANSNTASEKIKNNQVLKIGNETEYLADLKITNVSTAQDSFPEHMISLDNYDISKMVSISIEYTNKGIPDGFSVSNYDFQAFDEKGNPYNRVDQQDGNDIAAIDRTGKTRIFFELPNDGSKTNNLELDYSSSGKKIATFDLKVTH